MFREKSRKSVQITTAVLIFAIIISVFGFYQMNKYNDSVLDIYAKQQDAYVKLVLDQINLYSDRSDDEIISEILGSLNSSAKEYWTLSKNEQFLYVKDVTETNRYKGFTNENYYLSDSAKEFIDNLATNRVTHAKIDIDGEQYVASGTEFAYRNAQYKICLLTYDKVVLDSNSFLQARVTICVVIFVLVLVFLITAMSFTTVLDKKTAKIKSMEEHIKKQNLTIEELEDRMAIESSYNALDNVFHGKTLESFLEKLQKRGVAPITLVFVKKSKKLDTEGMIRRINRKTGKKYLKFNLKPEIFLFLYPKAAADEIEGKMKSAAEDIQILGICGIESESDTYLEQYKKFGERILKDD